MYIIIVIDQKTTSDTYILSACEGGSIVGVKLLAVEDCFKYDHRSIVPSFQFLDTTSPHFRFMRIQPRGELVASPETGVQSIDPLHMERCRHALFLAREHRVELFLTPEYCIPVQLIDEIIANPALQPHPNTLWCLCCEGLSLSAFEDHMNKWADHAYLGRGAVENLTYSYFVGFLLYIFMSADGDKLCIVPQSKVQPMREELHVCEQSGLSQGHEIVLFGRAMRNRLCSIICADAYHPDLKDSNLFFPHHAESNNIVLHPQLNSSPRHEDIAALRNRLFEQERGQHTLYITANWACGTSIRLVDRSEPVMKIRNPWSSIYRRNFNFGLHEMREGLREVQRHNLNYGLGFAYMKRSKLTVWYAIKQEHVQIIHLRKPYGGGPEITRSAGVQAQITYISNEKQDGWRKATTTFDHTLPSVLIGEATGDYAYPLNANVDELDRFFNYCLGYLDGNELLLDEQEKSYRLSYHIDDECENYRERQIGYVTKLFRYLKQLPTEKYPSQLRRIQGGFKFHVVDKAALNVVSKQAGTRDGALVAYVESAREAKERTLQLIDHLGEFVYGEKICIFSKDPFTDELIYFPQHNDHVTAAERVTMNSEFTQGGNSIEPKVD